MIVHIPPAPALLDTPLIVVTGKGGAGRTTVATALGLICAARGRRTIVCEVARQHRVAELMRGPTGRPGDEIAVSGGLWTTSIDPHAALEEWLGRLLPRRLGGVAARSGGLSAFLAASPGGRELLTMTKAWELAQWPRWRRDARPYDVVILDAPATGHGLGLLRTPRTFADIARVGPIAAQARAVHDALLDPARCAYVAVALPGELPVSETLELEERLAQRMGRDLHAIVVNGVWPRRITSGDLAALAAADGAIPASLHHAALAAADRVRTQQGQISRLRRHARAQLVPLPFVFTERLSAVDVRALGERLARCWD